MANGRSQLSLCRSLEINSARGVRRNPTTRNFARSGKLNWRPPRCRRRIMGARPGKRGWRPVGSTLYPAMVRWSGQVVRILSNKLGWNLDLRYLLCSRQAWVLPGIGPATSDLLDLVLSSRDVPVSVRAGLARLDPRRKSYEKSFLRQVFPLADGTRFWTTSALMPRDAPFVIIAICSP